MKQIVLVLTLAVITACGSETKSKHIKVGLNAEYAPYEYLKGSEYTGFNVEIVQNVLSNKGFTYEFVNMKFDGLIAALQSKKVDLLIGISPTETRKKSIDFTKKYSSDEQIILVSKETKNKYDINNLQGLRIGVLLGSIQETMLKSMDGVKIIAYDNYTGVLLELQNQKIDGALLASVSAQEYLKQNNQLVSLGKLEHTLTEGFALGLSKGNPELLKTLDESIDDLITNGIVEQLKQKYNL